MTAHASVYTLVLMSLDRYLAVVHPITSMTIRNVRNTSIALAVAWVIIVVANAPMLAVFQVINATITLLVVGVLARKAIIMMVTATTGKKAASSA